MLRKLPIQRKYVEIFFCATEAVFVSLEMLMNFYKSNNMAILHSARMQTIVQQEICMWYFEKVKIIRGSMKRSWTQE
jgi:hypothetical protein